MFNSFTSIGVPEPIARALAERGITAPFPVQGQTIPDALQGRDVAGKAPTGSGKTLAFGIPLLVRGARGTRRRPRSLILSPTRELAEQIKEELLPLGAASKRSVTAVYGGVPYGGQRTALNRGVDVLVATPGRLEDLIDQRLVSLEDVDLVVVDEADRMADMGFLPAVRRILGQTSSKRQTLLFSATLDGDVAVLVRDYQRNPVRHESGDVESAGVRARHHFWAVDHHDRARATADIIGRSNRSIVFTRTRHGADRLAKQLSRVGVRAVAMHGGRSQSQRQRALKSFTSGDVTALVATDVAARGIHVDFVDTVVHFDPAADHKDYVHRSGRTARAGEGGTVISLVTGEKRKVVEGLQRDLGMRTSIEKPDFASLTADPPEFRVATGRSRNGEGDGRREKVPPVSSIFVGNLPWALTGEELATRFSAHGRVLNATVVKDGRDGRSKGYGFVDMPRPDARVAIDALHGSTVGARRIKVRPARPEASNQA